MKKWWYASMLAVLTCLSVTAAAAAGDGAPADGPPADALEADSVPADATPADAAQVRQPIAPEVISEQAVDVSEVLGSEPEVEATSGSGRIICTFNCNDGFGLLYDCPESGLGACCAEAQPACAQHGGLESGICKQGRLGLPCTPI